jgi:hypothetical protein
MSCSTGSVRTSKTFTRTEIPITGPYRERRLRMTSMTIDLPGVIEVEPVGRSRKQPRAIAVHHVDSPSNQIRPVRCGERDVGRSPPLRAAYELLRSIMNAAMMWVLAGPDWMAAHSATRTDGKS